MGSSKRHRILIATDRSPPAHAAIEAAIRLPWSNSSRVRAIVAIVNRVSPIGSAADVLRTLTLLLIDIKYGGRSVSYDVDTVTGLIEFPNRTVESKGTEAMHARSVTYGAAAFVVMLAVYFGALTLVSGWEFTTNQFSQYWFYILPLTAGFALQVTLYSRLRDLLHGKGAGRRMVAASGATSTAAMISCCAHYLTNVVPILGATGLVTFAAQYQVEFFWIGIVLNIAGVLFIGSRLWKAIREQEQYIPA